MDKNSTFKYILCGYILVYAFGTKPFYLGSFPKKSFSYLFAWIQESVLPQTAVLLIFHFIGIKYLFPPIVDKLIISAEYKNEDRENRKALVSTNIFRFICFVYISLLGCTALYSVDWIPSLYLFGNPDISGNVLLSSLISEPDKYDLVHLPTNIQNYFQCATAYNLHSFIWLLIFCYGKYNFYEMLLHHVVTLSLISFCFISGHTSIGVLVTIIHDITDIPAYAIKIAVNTSSIALTLILYIILVTSWVYYRVFVFITAIIYPLYLDDYQKRVIENKGYNERTFNLILLSTLCVLHIFWISLFLQMGYRFLTAGEVHDAQETKRKQ